MKLKYIYKIGILSFCLTTFTGCDYLAVSDELASELTMEEVFENAAYTRRFHRGIYTGIPDVSFMSINESYGACSGLGLPWVACSDEMKTGHNNVKNIPVTGENAANVSLTRWSLYNNIRQANLFLERAHPIQSEKDQLDETELNQMRAEALFLRAYYHYLLFELYGPVPVLDYYVDPNSTDLDFARNSVDEVVEFCDRELLAVADLLKDSEPDERKAAPTKGAALAVRAKLWMYAASPLLNGGYKEAVELRDNEGKQLFPEYDATKWQKALDALQDFIDYSGGRYELYKVYDKKGTYDPDASLYELFQTYNNEIIWATTKDSWASVDGDGSQRRSTPRGVRGSQGMSSYGATQELVDAFFMKDGLSIKESPLYSEAGFTSITHDVVQLKDTVTVTDEIFNMYLNREPRFYQAIMYAGRRWHVGGEQVFFHKGAKDDNSSTNNCYTGYLLYKRVNRTLYSYGSYPRSWFRPGILFRLAEFYLLYAEALNEVNPSDNRIIEYVDRVRERAGIPLLKDIKPEIIGNQELQREAIRQESRVELCAEGQRYFDVRRWMIIENAPGEGGQAGNFHGMNMEGDYENFFKRTVFETRVTDRKTYLYAIPQSEILKSRKLVQNPLW
ncbi:RagB/SusD family nutrient uptake outer membrane protein [Parabacteroides goldsteinii]|uniref:RagB/SusD family nutrient uptake outer membrane protein n=1 Tax=Parabacteroides goldsteinii TaxID=328812 RepID=UPI0021667D27|nr:RagB/SusD family nutrient uptake outer membrane protein [Parabacteroides goldsteinii]MCS2427751.1 RagB/SusD family nutrient uptake outer membrane protein [Parabacteroides goldsteinii]